MSRPRVPHRAKSDIADKPLRADAQRNRDRVLAAARKLFEERGLDVEMDEIARCAEVGVGTIYRHFPTKEALVHGVAASFVERLVDAARKRADASDPGKALFEYLAIVAEEFSAKQSLGHTLNPSLSPAQASERREAFQSAMGALLSRAQRAGAVRRDVTAGDLVLLIRGTLSAESDPRSDTTARRRRFEIVCDGLRRGSS